MEQVSVGVRDGAWTRWEETCRPRLAQPLKQPAGAASASGAACQRPSVRLLASACASTGRLVAELKANEPLRRRSVRIRQPTPLRGYGNVAGFWRFGSTHARIATSQLA